MKRSTRRSFRPAIDVSGWLRRVNRRLPWYVPGDTLEGRNVRALYAETAWFGILSGLTATFVSVYALRLGATTAQVGWLTALPALVSVIWLVPAARLIERQRRRMPLLLWSALLHRAGYFAMALLPWVVRGGQVQALIVLNMLVTLPSAILNIAVTALLPDLAAPHKRGQVVMVRWLILAVTATLAALVGGNVLDLMPVPLNYQVLLGTGTLLSLLSLVCLRRIHVPEADQSRRPRASKARQKRGVRQQSQGLSVILSQKRFLRFALASFAFYWGLYLPAALWSVLRVRDLGATDTWIGIIAVVVDGSMIAGYLFWGKVRAKRGDRWVLLVTAAAVSLYALATAVVPSIQWMILTSILGGVAWAGCNLALFNVMLSVCPDDRRTTYLAVYTALTNVTAFAGPLLGAGLAVGIGIRWAFVASAGVRALGVALFLLLLRESKAPTIRPSQA